MYSMKRQEMIVAISKVSEVIDRLNDDSSKVSKRQLIESINEIFNVINAVKNNEIYVFE